MHLEPGVKVVGRAWRWDPDQIRADIEIDRRIKIADGESDPEPSISAFALEHPSGDAQDTTDNLLEGIRNHRNAKWVSVVTSSELLSAGFQIELSEPPPNHHDVVLPRDGLEEAIVRLSSVFDSRPRMRLK